MTRPPPRRCARAGCRAWAMRGQPWCRAHREDHDDEPNDRDVATPEDERHARLRAFAAAVRAAHCPRLDPALLRAIEAAASEPTLTGEIGALRLVLQRVLAADALDGDPDRLAATATKLVDGIVRATRMQHTLAGEQADELTGAFTTILRDLGLGDEP